MRRRNSDALHYFFRGVGIGLTVADCTAVASVYSMASMATV